MEPEQHKLSCEDEEGGCRERMADRLSNLPDHIAHRILSFLTMYDLARLSCVSKCCRRFCLSTPFLNFSPDNCMAAADITCDRQQNLLNSLERFFLLRGSNKIQRFRFAWRDHSENQTNQISPCICRDFYSRVMSWVHKAVKCNVEELDLRRFCLGETMLHFPSSIFLCESLKSLSLFMWRPSILKAPSVSFSSNLKTLKLINVVIEDEEDFSKWISCSCKCIQHLDLYIRHGIKNVNIESSSLERFTLCLPTDFDFDLDTLHISGENLQLLAICFPYGSPSITSLNVCAPNLKWFFWWGNLLHYQNPRKYESVEYPTMSFSSVGNASLGKFGFSKFARIGLEPKVDDFDPLCELLRSLTRIEFLTLNEAAIKVLFKLKGSTPVSFKNICSLRMDFGCIIDETVPAMVSVFAGMPYLHTLRIKHCPPLHELKSNKCGFDMGYWKSANLAFINQLKHFTIELSDGSNGVELAKYILECAKKLEKIVLICSPQNLKEVKRELEKAKMISHATIVFKERPEK